MKSLLLGMGSRARVGKDYAIIKLKELGYDVERISFADCLKDDLTVVFARHNLNLTELLNDPQLKETIRPLLVEYGQTLRKFKEDVWVDAAFKNHEFKHEITMVSDVRFPNEAKRIKSLGGYYVEIKSDVPCANETEALFSPQMVGLADFTVQNSFDGKFVADMIELIERLRYEKRTNSQNQKSRI